MRSTVEARARTLLKTRSRHGFTLVETLVVITILTILVTIVIVAAKSIGDARRRSVAQQQLAVISQAIGFYSAALPGNTKT